MRLCCLFSLAFVFRIGLALFLLLYHLLVGAADGQVDGSEVLCFLQCGDLKVLNEVPSVGRAGRLVGSVLSYSPSGKRESWSGVSGHNIGK